MTPDDADLVRSLAFAANPMCWRAADALERLSAEKDAAEARACTLEERMSWVAGHDRRGLDHLNEMLAAVARAEAAEADADRLAADRIEQLQAENARLTAALAAANELLGWAIAIIENADHCMGYDLMTQFGRDIAPDEAGEWADDRNKWREAFHASFTQTGDDRG